MKIKLEGPRADMIILIYFSLASGAGLSNGADAPPSPSSAPLYCFVKISTGERLIGYDVTRIIDRTTVDACQKECLIYKCTHFSFGTYSKENGTCELTTGRQISRRLDSKFELYEKTDECIAGKPKGYEREGWMLPKRSRDNFLVFLMPSDRFQDMIPARGKRSAKQRDNLVAKNLKKKKCGNNK